MMCDDEFATERFVFSPVTPSRLPTRLLLLADAISWSSARNPGFWIEHVTSGVAVRVDLRAHCLSEAVRAAIATHFGDQSELLVIVRDVRSQHLNVAAAFAKVEALLAPVLSCS